MLLGVFYEVDSVPGEFLNDFSGRGMEMIFHGLSGLGEFVGNDFNPVGVVEVQAQVVVDKIEFPGFVVVHKEAQAGILAHEGLSVLEADRILGHQFAQSVGAVPVAEFNESAVNVAVFVLVGAVIAEIAVFGIHHKRAAFRKGLNTIRLAMIFCEYTKSIQRIEMLERDIIIEIMCYLCNKVL